MKKIYIMITLLLLTVFNLQAERVIIKVKNEFNSCQDIKSNGFSTGNGNYEINFLGELRTVYCNMESSEEGITQIPFEISLLDYEEIEIYSPLIFDHSNAVNNVYNNQPLTLEEKNQLQYLIDNNLTEWIRYTVKAYRNGNYSDVQNGDLILESFRTSYFSRDIRIPLPEGIQNINNNSPILIYAELYSWAGDSDGSRMYFQQRDINDDPIDGTIYDSGTGNWSSTRTYRQFESTLENETTQLRFFGSCTRRSGSICSASVLDYTFVLYPKLPKIDELVTIVFKE